MKFGNRLKIVLTLFAAMGLVYGTWAAVRAHRNLVTLDVRDLDVRQVVKTLRWQTWEDIFVNQAVQGKVTLNVRQKPLDEVLRMIAAQTASRASVIYPLYSNANSLHALEKALRGEVDAATHGWTNLQSRSFGRAPMDGRGIPGTVPQNQQVSLNLSGKDLQFASLAFNRLAQTRVVPEDGASATVSMIVSKVTVSTAVARLAERAHLKWTTLYALQAGSAPGRRGIPGDRLAFAGGGTNQTRRLPGGDQFRDQRGAFEAELAQTLPPEERQKFEEAQAKRDQQMREMANLSPEQRRDRFTAGGPALDQMNRQRILNSTPEQRARSFGPPRGAR